MLLIATTLVSAINVNKTNSKPMLYDADVPIWEVGDSWIYKWEQRVRSDLNETMAYTTTCDLIYTVVDDSDGYYTLEGIGESASTIGNIGKLGLKNSRIYTSTYDLVLKQSDLSVSSAHLYAKGIMFIVLGSIVIPFPIQVAVWRNSEFSPHRQIFPFPLYDGKNGSVPSVLTTEDWGTTMFWGLIEADVGNNSWWSAAHNYTCMADQTTVPAGTYDVYNVTWSSDFGNKLIFHYNSTVGNIVKSSVVMFHGAYHDWWMIQKQELISTTYTP
jgi:hypothetical protein